VCPALHIAGFDPDDPDALIGASLACQYCLSGAEALIVLATDDDPVAFAECSRCATLTEIVLSPPQMLRLLVSPPHRLLVTVLR
jgi:hypothetical protein